MPDASTLSDQELNARIAEAMGWAFHDTGTWGWYYNVSDEGAETWGKWKPMPGFASSIDAVKQAEEKLVAAKWFMNVEQGYDAQTEAPSYFVSWSERIRQYEGIGRIETASAATEARARAEACLAALLAIAASTPADMKEK